MRKSGFNNPDFNKPDSRASSAEISFWNNVDRPPGEKRMPLPTEPGHPSYVAPPVVQQSQPQKPYVSPNPISDFFAAKKHTTPFPHNAGYRPPSSRL